jgi:hypothetical protein
MKNYFETSLIGIKIDLEIGSIIDQAIHQDKNSENSKVACKVGNCISRMTV